MFSSFRWYIFFFFSFGLVSSSAKVSSTKVPLEFLSFDSLTKVKGS